jgi:hypothetical protein
VQVSGVGFQGSGFGTNTNFPITIPPEGSTTIDVKSILDTTGGKLSNSATLDIISDADNKISPITLIKSYQFPHPVHLWLDADKTPLTAGNSWKVKLKGLPNELADVRTIDLAINYNTDLLGYFKSSGTNTTSSADGKSFTISGSPMITTNADSSIAELNFNVYLTKDTSTSLAINSISLNMSDPKFMGCVAYPLSSGSDFLYLNTCGDRSIRTFMLGKPIEMTIRPNPAQDEIEIDLQSPVKQDASIEIFDQLGNKMSSHNILMTNGTNRTNINTAIFPQGMYLVRITSPIGSVSQTFVKVK